MGGFTRTELEEHYDSLTPDEQDMPKEEFVTQAMGLTDMTSMRKEAGVIFSHRMVSDSEAMCRQHAAYQQKFGKPWNPKHKGIN